MSVLTSVCHGFVLITGPRIGFAPRRGGRKVCVLHGVTQACVTPVCPPRACVLHVYAVTFGALKLPEWLYHDGPNFRLSTYGEGGQAAGGRRTPELSSGVTISTVRVLICSIHLFQSFLTILHNKFSSVSRHARSSPVSVRTFHQAPSPGCCAMLHRPLGAPGTSRPPTPSSSGSAPSTC
jgi:hypothetical protein